MAITLSPAELSYLHESLSLTPPIRPDGRKANQFRPLTAETGILPGTNGSARICFADGTEAVVGVKAEIEKTAADVFRGNEDVGLSQEDKKQDPKTYRNEWVQLSIDIPGYRSEDAGLVYLASMLNEALVCDGSLPKKLYINSRFHWKLHIDVLLLSPPTSYPLPLLSCTVHLALLATRLPKLISEGDEDPMFDDDWEASTFVFPASAGTDDARLENKSKQSSFMTERPPVTLLIASVGQNILFDPSSEELAVADVALAVSIAQNSSVSTGATPPSDTTLTGGLRLLSIRMIDPPSRLTPPGVANSDNPATGTGTTDSTETSTTTGLVLPSATAPNSLHENVHGVWNAPLGGVKFSVLGKMTEAVMERGGVGEEVLAGLAAVDLS